MIIRGTTPTLSFNIDTQLDLNNIAELWITFKAKPPYNVEKTFELEDVTVDAENNTILLSLSQDDTLAFTDTDVQVQIRLRMDDSLAYASAILDTKIGQILKDGVI